MVFNRFWRADPARARTTGGTGLGLSISLEDAHLHGGWLQAWGEPGQGAQFRLTLPRVAGERIGSSPLPLVPLDAGAGTDRQRPPARRTGGRAVRRPALVLVALLLGDGGERLRRPALLRTGALGRGAGQQRQRHPGRLHAPRPDPGQRPDPARRRLPDLDDRDAAQHLRRPAVPHRGQQPQLGARAGHRRLRQPADGQRAGRPGHPRAARRRRARRSGHLAGRPHRRQGPQLPAAPGQGGRRVAAEPAAGPAADPADPLRRPVPAAAALLLRPVRAGAGPRAGLRPARSAGPDAAARQPAPGPRAGPAEAPSGRSSPGAPAWTASRCRSRATAPPRCRSATRCWTPGTPTENLLFAQIAWTLGQLPGVQRVRVTVGGTPIDLPGSREDVGVDDLVGVRPVGGLGLHGPVRPPGRPGGHLQHDRGGARHRAGR